MLKIKFTAVIASMVLCASAGAVTFAQLAEKNARYIDIKTDLAIAKAETELAEQRAKKPGNIFGSVDTSVPAIKFAGSPAAPKGAPDKGNEPNPGRDIFLNAIHGAASNPEADWQRQGSAISRKKGETVFDEWHITSIAYPRVSVIKRATAKKEKDVCKNVSIGTSITSAPNC